VIYWNYPGVLRVITLGKMRWEGHVERMGKGEAYTGNWRGKLWERNCWRDPGVDGKLILKWIFGK
jgi:hypothetical protein